MKARFFACPDRQRFASEGFYITIQVTTADILHGKKNFCPCRMFAYEKGEGMMSRGKARLLLLAVFAARGTSFLFSKTLLQSMEPMSILAVRFLLAFLIPWRVAAV